MPYSRTVVALAALLYILVFTGIHTAALNDGLPSTAETWISRVCSLSLLLFPYCPL